MPGKSLNRNRCKLDAWINEICNLSLFEFNEFHPEHYTIHYARESVCKNVCAKPFFQKRKTTNIKPIHSTWCFIQTKQNLKTKANTIAQSMSIPQHNGFNVKRKCQAE